MPKPIRWTFKPGTPLADARYCARGLGCHLEIDGDKYTLVRVLGRPVSHARQDQRKESDK